MVEETTELVPLHDRVSQTIQTGRQRLEEFSVVALEIAHAVLQREDLEGRVIRGHLLPSE